MDFPLAPVQRTILADMAHLMAPCRSLIPEDRLMLH
jgi:hypothetical protein